MKLSESFALLGISTAGDADNKYDRYLPRLRRDGSIAFGDVDGRRIESVRVREVAQWVSTLEDNDDLTYAILSAGKRDLRAICAKATMYVTDARVVFVQDKVKNPDQRVVGHLRYPWIDAILWRPRLGGSQRPMLQLWMHENFPVKHLGSWHHYIELEFDDSVDPAVLALDLTRRVSAHNLAHGAPAWIHNRLREQSQITHLPEPDDTGEGLWSCPASVVCPHGADYIGDSPPPAEWIGRGEQPPEAEPVAEPEPRAPSTIILKRMLARGKSIARERGHDVIGTDDLLLALLIDDETQVGQLMERHGAGYEPVKRQLDSSPPRYEPRAGQPRWPDRARIRVGTRKLGVTNAIGLMNTMRDIGRREDAGDHGGALAHGQRLVALADQARISTLRALAQVQIGDSYLALGRLDDAHNAFAAAAALRSAPTVTVAPFVPKLDPVDVVDSALYGLWEVADKRNDKDETAGITAVEHLREFRSRYGSDDEATAWTAAQLARVHGRNEDCAAAAQWAETAREEYGRAGNTESAADAAAVLALARNDSGEPEHALSAAEQAVEGAIHVGNKELEMSARFQRARANRALGNNAIAWDELLALLPDERRRNASMARAIVIQMAEIDVVAAAAHAIEVADTDTVFYGPRSAEITLAAARSLLTDDVDEARRLLIHSVRLAAGVLSHPDTVDGNVDRGFTTLGDALTASDDQQFTQEALRMLVDSLPSLDPARLFRLDCLEFLKALGTAERFDVQAALARPIVDRLAAIVDDEPRPAVGDLVALVRRYWELSRGLKFSGQREAALRVHEDLLGWLRSAAEMSPAERPRLGFHLTGYGIDLMAANRYAEADNQYVEAIDLLRSLMSEGEDCAWILAQAIRFHARLAALTGDHVVQRSRLREALTVLDNAGTEDWVDQERAKIQTDLTDENEA
ncbi:Clp protease N-terminal domain-containing protein [Nocardia rhizosphaerihabitans]|uniref:Clp protease N-terminal domain-containing protein n=1 Tax=Nocardia rhizosphaerihabitans TaxID=1691570 RepID=UPI00366FC1EF